jgi:hypothetical protein
MRAARVIRALLRPVRVPADGEALDGGELRKLVALSRAWRDRAGTRALAAAERTAEQRARKAAGRA